MLVGDNRAIVLRVEACGRAIRIVMKKGVRSISLRCTVSQVTVGLVM